MLNRHVLRVKVMQALYAYQQQDIASTKKAQDILDAYIEKGVELYLYIWSLFTEVVFYINKEQTKIDSKFLDSNKGKIVSRKLLDGPLFQEINNNRILQDQIKLKKTQYLHDEKVIESLFYQLSSSSEYQAYLKNGTGSTLKEDARLFSTFIKQILVMNEDFTSHIEYIFPNWLDDGDLVLIQIIKELDKLKKGKERPQPDLSANQEKEFGKDILVKTLRYENELTALIQERIKNWELERITTIDMILLKLSLCELLYCPTIPVKVTMNEYIEISKEYSTPKSKEFINGIIDKLHDLLKNEGRIEKTGRGLVE